VNELFVRINAATDSFILTKPMVVAYWIDVFWVDYEGIVTWKFCVFQSYPEISGKRVNLPPKFASMLRFCSFFFEKR
jgi:hypothetical protein